MEKQLSQILAALSRVSPVEERMQTIRNSSPYKLI